ncbi:uncharacterized protein LOC144744554 isoform X2 [Ciona intestinalis]
MGHLTPLKTPMGPRYQLTPQCRHHHPKIGGLFTPETLIGDAPQCETKEVTTDLVPMTTEEEHQNTIQGILIVVETVTMSDARHRARGHLNQNIDVGHENVAQEENRTKEIIKEMNTQT